MNRIPRFRFFFLILFLPIFAAAAASAQTKPRARDLGVPFDGAPGTNNAITDVKGVEVGHTTLISGNGKLKSAKAPFAPASPRFCPAEKPRPTRSLAPGSRSTAMEK